MYSQEIERIMSERFGKDSLIALATSEDNIPYVRAVNAYYEDGCFYVITYGKSGKMQQLQSNPTVAICGDWFTGQGEGTNLGWFQKEENGPIAEKLRVAFSAWIHNGHNDFSDENTVILRIRITSGTLFSHGKRYVL